MPRLSKAVPSYRKHRPTDQAVVTLNGRDYYLGPHGTKASKLEYDRLIAEWLQRGRQAQTSKQFDCLSVVELIVAYLHYARGYYRKDGKPTGEVEAIRLSLRCVKAMYGRRPVAEFGPTALKVVRQKMVDDGLSRKLVNQRIGRVKRMFKWGAAAELVSADIHQSLAVVEGLKCGRTDARETAPIRPVDDSVVDVTLPRLPAVVADMVRLQRLTGMRPAEIVAVRPIDLDRSGEIWTYRVASHKTQHHGKQRSVYIGPQAQVILLRYLARDPEACCFRPCDSEAKRLAARHADRKTPLSCGNRPGTNRLPKPKRRAGERYSVTAYRRAIYRACDLLQIDHWAPNRIRHTAATEIRQKFGLEAAQITLGHSRADVTQVYAERDMQKAVEVARQIG